MRRRDFIALLGGTAVARSLPARASLTPRGQHREDLDVT